MTALDRSGGEPARVAVHRSRDALEPFGAVVHRVHRSQHRRQHLRGADVRGRLLAPDVLLAGLQREPVGDAPARVARHADHASRQAALELVAGGDVGGVRSTESHRHAEALGRADGDVGPHLSGRPQQDERERVGRHHRERAGARARARSAAGSRGSRRSWSGTAAARRTPSRRARRRDDRRSPPRRRAPRRASPPPRASADGSRRRRRTASARRAPTPGRSPSLRRPRCPRRAARRWPPAGR